MSNHLLGYQLDQVLMPPQLPKMDDLKSHKNDGTAEMLTAVRGMLSGLMYEAQIDKQVSCPLNPWQ